MNDTSIPIEAYVRVLENRLTQLTLHSAKLEAALADSPHEQQTSEVG